MSRFAQFYGLPPCGFLAASPVYRLQASNPSQESRIDDQG
jgi:hypothetical protein